jgi:hypothetical protein
MDKRESDKGIGSRYWDWHLETHEVITLSIFLLLLVLLLLSTLLLLFAFLQPSHSIIPHSHSQSNIPPIISSHPPSLPLASQLSPDLPSYISNATNLYG